MIVKASFSQHYKGEYIRKDEPFPRGANREALVRSGQGYFDLEPAKPTMSNTKKEIEQYLDENSIEYSEHATKSELIDLIC